MALIEKGNSLVSQLIQPGWTISNDGFGLLTSTTVFKCDHTTSVPSFAARGTSHPDSSFNNLKAHKYRISYDSLGIATVTVDYVGISQLVNGGLMTIPSTSSANGLTAEPLTSHPNFYEHDDAYGNDALAGKPTDFPNNQYPESDIGPTVATPSGNAKSRIGNWGACFEKPLGGRFIGFVDPDYSDIYGKTQYLARTTTYSGTVYMTSVNYVNALLALLNSATDTNSWGIFTLLPDWAPVGVNESGLGNLNLLSQVNVEEFGSLYKVNYEIRYSKAGWPEDVYINI